jgi:hypothetical protein
MLEQIIKKSITADPSKFSLREEALDLKFTGVERKFPLSYSGQVKKTEGYIDQETGEKFYKIDSFNVSAHRLLSLILKGVVNVSDVVKVGDQYSSHEQNFNNLESKEENVVAEAEADIFIIKNIFGDPDHEYYPVNHFSRQKIQERGVDSKLEHHNLRINETEGKLSFFDLRSTYLVEDTSLTEDFLELEEKFQKEITKSKFATEKNAVLDVVKKKVSILVSLFLDNEFTRFETIVKKSEVKLKEDKQRILFNKIKSRLQALNKVLSELN